MNGWTRQADSEGLQTRRSAYARHIAALARIDLDSEIGREIVAAFEAIPREKFLGHPPWRIISPDCQHAGSSQNPADLYRDVLVTLNMEKGLNNGQPSLHALSLNALAPQKGERAIHVGAGTGYYTAVLAMLVGETGHVDAYEIEREFAQQARTNLAGYPQVAVCAYSGADAPLPYCDVLNVSAACAEPLDVWLDALNCGGRLLFPLEPEGQAGQLLLVTRQSEQEYSARFLGAVQYVACLGAQAREAIIALEAAFRGGNWQATKSLHRNSEPDESCWCAGRGWWLSTR
jgi:protein-L-isoaspartate(D-aspartate) O-methyltransferase